MSQKINEVVLNLLTNSIEAIKEVQESEGLIRITTALVDDCVEIRVCDNGPGIPLDIQDRIFDPFFTTKEVGEGTGQGLSFVYDVVVNKHGGAIQVACPDGGGTTFTVQLPIETRQNASKDRRENANSIG